MFIYCPGCIRSAYPRAREPALQARLELLAKSSKRKCPGRITVLHKTGTLGPSGRLGSTPSPGVDAIEQSEIAFISESNRFDRINCS